MKKSKLLLLLLTLTVFNAVCQRSIPKELIFRFDSKIGADLYEHKFDTIEASISQLNKLIRPNIKVNQFSTRSEAEMKMVEVTGWFVSFSMEKDNSIRVILKDDDSNYISLFIPDENDIWTSAFITHIKVANNDFHDFVFNNLLMEKKVYEDKYKVKALGFLFFDKPNQFKLNSVNNLELRPIIKFSQL